MMALNELIDEEIFHSLNVDYLEDPIKELPDHILGLELLYINKDWKHYEATIKGPKDTPYEGGLFVLDIHHDSYNPYKPPEIQFKTQIFHPNIGSNGKICLDILLDEWRPTLTLEKTLLSICSLLSDPNIDDFLVPEAAYLYINNREEYNRKAGECTKKYAMTINNPAESQEHLRELANIIGTKNEVNQTSLSSSGQSMQQSTDESSPIKTHRSARFSCFEPLQAKTFESGQSKESLPIIAQCLSFQGGCSKNDKYKQFDLVVIDDSLNDELHSYLRQIAYQVFDLKEFVANMNIFNKLDSFLKAMNDPCLVFNYGEGSDFTEDSDDGEDVYDRYIIDELRDPLKEIIGGLRDQLKRIRNSGCDFKMDVSKLSNNNDLHSWLMEVLCSIFDFKEAVHTLDINSEFRWLIENNKHPMLYFKGAIPFFDRINQLRCCLRKIWYNICNIRKAMQDSNDQNELRDDLQRLIDLMIDFHDAAIVFNDDEYYLRNYSENIIQEIMKFYVNLSYLDCDRRFFENGTMFEVGISDLENMLRKFDKKDKLLTQQQEIMNLASDIQKKITNLDEEEKQANVRKEIAYLERMFKAFFCQNYKREISFGKIRKMLNDIEIFSARLDINKELRLLSKALKEEGSTSSRTAQSENLMDTLEKVMINGSIDEIRNGSLYLYSMDTFLYREVNRFLREADMTKIEMYGSFVRLLYFCFENSSSSEVHSIEVYRGMNLSPTMIDAYTKAAKSNTSFRWAAFSSTTKSRKFAEHLNTDTLFIMQLNKIYLTEKKAVDISDISIFSEEEEVLLKAGVEFTVDKVTKDNEIKKNYIYLNVYV